MSSNTIVEVSSPYSSQVTLPVIPDQIENQVDEVIEIFDKISPAKSPVKKKIRDDIFNSPAKKNLSLSFPILEQSNANLELATKIVKVLEKRQPMGISLREKIEQKIAKTLALADGKIETSENEGADHYPYYISSKTLFIPLKEKNFTAVSSSLKIFHVGIEIREDIFTLKAITIIRDWALFNQALLTIDPLKNHSCKHIVASPEAQLQISSNQIVVINKLYDGNLQEFLEELRSYIPISLLSKQIQFVYMWTKAGKGVLEMHQLGCSHQDIKPHQFLIISKDDAILGKKKVILSDLDSVKKEGQPPSCVYSKPYRIKEEQHSQQADLYAFGKSLELTGKKFSITNLQFEILVKSLTNQKPEKRPKIEQVVETLKEIKKSLRESTITY
ncbi:MAG: hypothetical protein L0207_00740 [Chlamydiae bacterium]|nr:hypothetical protein [Chlamydiota bacterium]